MLRNVLFELSPQQVIKRISGYNTTEDGDLPVYLKSMGILSLPTGTKALPMPTPKELEAMTLTLHVKR